ncbi:hypothetical protein BC834DRAFT_432722 [Gloeopeniophorella convolvens]|nr:hypothetical protein BC834DRAFT_432722 [Gloeopeniophorella convolvens]
MMSSPLCVTNRGTRGSDSFARNNTGRFFVLGGRTRDLFYHKRIREPATDRLRSFRGTFRTYLWNVPLAVEIRKPSQSLARKSVVEQCTDGDQHPRSYTTLSTSPDSRPVCRTRDNLGQCLALLGVILARGNCFASSARLMRAPMLGRLYRCGSDGPRACLRPNFPLCVLEDRTKYTASGAEYSLLTRTFKLSGCPKIRAFTSAASAIHLPDFPLP